MFLNKKHNYRMPFYNPPQNKKKQHPNIFSKGSPISKIDMFVVVVLYCVQLFLK